MNKDDTIIKRRAILNPRSFQLIREKATVQYALTVVPQIIEGVKIIFPDINISLRHQVMVRSKRIKGQNLLEMIYNPGTQRYSLEMALIALKALSRSDITSNPFIFFGIAYRLIRRLKVTQSDVWGTSILTREQREKLNHLVSSYSKNRKGDRKVLVHGDLHAGNLVVNREDNSLGFVDLEMMHVGKSATNFAQLWISYHFADPSLGQSLYHQYVDHLPETLNEHFDADVRAEIVLRCHSMVKEAKKSGHSELERKSTILREEILKSDNFFDFIQRIIPSTREDNSYEKA